MNQLIKSLQEIIDRKAENNELKQELSTLIKMLKLGFLNKPVGMEKVPKVYASNDTKKIKKFYDTFGSQINAIKFAGNFDEFATYLKCEFGIEVTYTSPVAPNIQYAKKGKKLAKFNDLYEEYFLEPAGRSATDSMAKILASLDNLTKEYINVNEEVKDGLKSIIENDDQHSPEIVKTVDKILTKARLKVIKVEDVTNEVEAKLHLQQQAVDIVNKNQ